MVFKNGTRVYQAIKGKGFTERKTILKARTHKTTGCICFVKLEGNGTSNGRKRKGILRINHGGAALWLKG